MQIDQGTLVLPRPVLISSNDDSNLVAAAIMSFYGSYAVGAAKAVRDSLGSRPDGSRVINRVDQMLKFEVQLAAVSFIY